ncbi:MAG: response regulator transcription factor [Desulfoprunum sp.]|nr:response regulator transcription factor [Desulfoprunum sp.]
MKADTPLRILVIEDNKDLAGNITDFLSMQGHEVDYAMDGITGLHLALNLPLDIIVLDIMLPKIDGLSICQRFRKEADKQLPIIMLTARDTLDDKLKGFSSGADDYLVKPFSLRELEARIKALAKRYDTPTMVISRGDLIVDFGTREVRQGERLLNLNRISFEILIHLVRSAPNVVTRDFLEDKLWGGFLPGSDALRSHIYSLRKELDNGAVNSWIETVRGVGYRLIER